MLTLKRLAKKLPNTSLRKVLSNAWHGYKWRHQFIYFLLKHPGVKTIRLQVNLLATLRHKGFHSQFGQDYFLNELIFNGKREGIFIDIGANDPEYNSNSYFFEKKLDWRGFAIEPQKKFQQKWAQLRSAEFINVGVGAKREQKQFIEYSSPNAWEDQLSCVVGHERTEDKSLGGEIYDILILPLREILEERRIMQIDLLSVDVEGYEGEVLKGIDFDKIRPTVVLLENMAKIRGSELLRSTMKAHGYKLLYRIWTTDDVYVDTQTRTA